MEKSFRDIETAFRDLKASFNEGAITRRDFIDRLKRLRLKDDEGRFWMIGAQSGTWYCYDGNAWLQAEPPTLGDRKAICIYCGYENDLTDEVCGRCGGRVVDDEAPTAAAPPESEAGTCSECGAQLRYPGQICPYCAAGRREDGPPGAERGRDEGASAEVAEAAAIPGPDELVLRAVKILSFTTFSGITGAILGALLGLLTGATAIFPGIVAGLPDSLIDLQGKLVGALVYTLMGAGLGAIVMAAMGTAAALLMNFVFSFTGGLRFRVGGK